MAHPLHPTFREGFNRCDTMSAAKISQQDHGLQTLPLGDVSKKQGNDAVALLEGLVPFSEILEQTFSEQDTSKKSELPSSTKTSEKTKKPEVISTAIQKPQLILPVVLPEHHEVTLKPHENPHENPLTRQTFIDTRDIPAVALLETVDVLKPTSESDIKNVENPAKTIDAAPVAHVSDTVGMIDHAPHQQMAIALIQSAPVLPTVRLVETKAPVVEKEKPEQAVEISHQAVEISHQDVPTQKEESSTDSQDQEDVLLDESIPKEFTPLKGIKPQEIQHIIKQARTEKPTAIDTLAVDAKAELSEKALKIEELLQNSNPIILRGIVSGQAPASAPRSLLQQEVPLSAYPQTQIFDMKPTKEAAPELGIMGRPGMNTAESLSVHANTHGRGGHESGGSSLGSSRDQSASMMQAHEISGDKMASNFQEALSKTHSHMNAENIEKMQTLQQLVSDFRSKLTGLTKSIRIPLRHERYGAIDVNIKFNNANKSVQADFDVENEQMLHLIKDNIAEIERIFKETGFNSAHSVTLQKISLTHKRIEA